MFIDKLIGLPFFVLNIFNPKIKKSIFFNADYQLKRNCIDIINNGSNNALHFLREFIGYKYEEKVTVIVEYLEDERLPLYKELSEAVRKNNIDLRFIRGAYDKTGFEKLKLYIKKYYVMQKCRIWLVSTGDVHFYGKLKSQKIFNFNYFISCKNDFVKGKNYRWRHCDYLVTTSLLNSTAASAQMGVKYDNCFDLGFPRNDVLFSASKSKEIMKWIEAEIGYKPEKIIVYAPTARDYKEENKRHLFGYKMDNLGSFLEDNKICLVCKLHNYTSKDGLYYPNGVIDFKFSYEYSFYDLMAVSDCVITDYSSVGYDFMLLDRPLIYNLYDLEMYEKDRGMSYEPYDEFCPGVVVKCESEMMKALLDFANGKDEYKEKRERLTKYFHKYPDSNSTSRAIDFFCKNFGYRISDR